MKALLSIIYLDYLKRIRSYSFLVTLCLSAAIAASFIPQPGASYSTVNIAGYTGYYNAAWIGTVTALMTSIFLSMFGFYLVNGSIKVDDDSGVGQIIASTPVGNFRYLFSKVLSNFLILATIVLAVFMMAVLLFFFYDAGYSLEIGQFIRPYLFITIPALFFISVLAVVFEVLFKQYSVIQNIGFFFLFVALSSTALLDTSITNLDIFNGKIASNEMIKAVKQSGDVSGDVGLNIGFSFNEDQEGKKFEFEGASFTTAFILSRLVWMLIGIAVVAVLSPAFHRFRQSSVGRKQKRKKTELEAEPISGMDLKALSIPETDFGILPILKTELLLLVRSGKKWLWILNLIGVGLLAFLPLTIAHQFVLPILWFLQVGRVSQLSCKEQANKVHYFTWFSFNALYRITFTQVLAALLLMISLASPLLLRYGIQQDFAAVGAISLGALTIVAFAFVLGILTGGKKLFEVLFFLVTYININGMDAFDYFGAMEHNSSHWYILILMVGVLMTTGLLKRYREIYA